MNKLLQLLADNKGSGRRVYAKASEDKDTTTVYLYDAITADAYWGGVTARDMAAALDSVTTPNIDLRINSPGGDVFAGKTIAALVRAHPAHVTVYVDGLAASAASLVAIAGDKVLMAPGAFLMIHKSWVLIAGNSDDMMDTAALLEKVDTSIAAEYAARAGITADEAMELMAAETWLSAAEAVESKFADGVVTDEVAEPKAMWKLGAYKNVPVRAALGQEQQPVLLTRCARGADEAGRKLRLLERSVRKEPK